MIFILIIIGTFRIIQTDWVSGPGVLGPVNYWGKAFYKSDSITYNVQGQISPVSSGVVNYNSWTKHIIDTDANIKYHSIVAADFDGDGNIDFAGWKGRSNTLQFYKNDGSNNFTKVNSYTGPGGGPGDWDFIATADFNNDGKPDVVVPAYNNSGSGGGLMWFENTGNFNFTPHTISSSKGYWNVTVGDIDNSGNISIIADGDIYKNTGGGNFTLSQTLSVPTWKARFDDMNNDGYKDLLLDDATDGIINIYLNKGDGTFPGTPSDTLVAPGVDGLWTRDFNNDGYEDILCGCFFNTPSQFNNLYWYENSGDGINYTKHNVYAPGNNQYYGDGAYAEDLDMDGKADVVSSFQKLAWFRQITFDNFTEYQIDSFGSNNSHWVIPFQIGRGTCAKSGEIDLLVCYVGNFAWYENNMISQFAANAHLESSILKSFCVDSGAPTNWLYFGYDVCNPASGDISFQFRTGNTTLEDTTAAWSTSVPVTATGEVKDSIPLVFPPSDQLFQYRVNCKGGTDAPIVYDVWVTYQCGASGIDEVGNRYICSLKIQGNVICYSLPEKANVSISLYDVTGRLARAINKGEQEAGIYEVAISGLKSGVYFVSFSYNGIKTTQKMVLLK